MASEHLLRDLLERLGHLQRSYLRDFAYSRGLNLCQLESLLYLSKCNHYSDTPIALAEYLGLTKGTISQTIISLAKKKFLSKSNDQRDGRITHLKLTGSAVRVVAQCINSSPIDKSIDGSSRFTESLEQALMQLLVTIQRTHQSRTFGICNTCRFFRKNGLGNSHQCGLTKEPLHERQCLKICREHSDSDQLALQ